MAFAVIGLLGLAHAPHAWAVPMLVLSPPPHSWHATAHPRWFREALCIHAHEGAWTSIGYVAGRATYGGGLQFLLSTWRGAGGRAQSLDDIARSTPREQLYRAWIVYRRDGNSWVEWGTAAACGLR